MLLLTHIMIMSAANLPLHTSGWRIFLLLMNIYCKVMNFSLAKLNPLKFYMNQRASTIGWHVFENNQSNSYFMRNI